ARGLSAMDKTQLEKLKKEWREEWEREEYGDEQETLDSIDRFIDDMRERREANMGPRTRAAYEEARRIEKEENANYGSWFDEEDGDEDEAEADETAAAPAPLQLPAPGAENDTQA